MTVERTAGDGSSEPEFRLRGFGKRAAGPNRRIHVAAVLALTEPGPAAAGSVVLDDRGRVVASRSSYLGRARLDEATAQALITALRLAHASELESPTFLTDDARLAEAMAGEMRSCECADFLCRGIPCKHLLVVARQQGATEQLFVGKQSA